MAHPNPFAYCAVQLESRVNPGRRFQAIMSDEPIGKRKAGPRILWVDDHPENNSALQGVIEECGCRVRNAFNTHEAMTVVSSKHVEIVITDMGRDEDPAAGLELLRKLGTAHVESPMAVFTSARAVAEYGDEARALGAKECTAGTVQLMKFLSENIRKRFA
jgi:CheY-like chemotaxis protein